MGLWKILGRTFLVVMTYATQTSMFWENCTQFYFRDAAGAALVVFEKPDAIEVLKNGILQDERFFSSGRCPD